MSRRDSHVHTVKCPECGVIWTGQFMEPVPDEAICRNCVAKKPERGKEHPDIHINRAYGQQ